MNEKLQHSWKILRKWIIAGASIGILWLAGSKIDAVKVLISNLNSPDSVAVTPFGSTP